MKENKVLHENPSINPSMEAIKNIRKYKQTEQQHT